MKADNNSRIIITIKFNCCKSKKKKIEFNLKPDDEIFKDIKNILIKYPELLKSNNLNIDDFIIDEF
jgi:hypothetical protein